MNRVYLALVVLWVGCAGTVVSSAPQVDNLLAGKTPVAEAGVAHVERLTDGLAASEGEAWLTDVTSRLTSSAAYVTFDLGQATPIRCALLSGDNNDHYRLARSDDGAHFAPLWTAGPVAGAGMRLRSTTLDQTARFVRLSADGGDGSYSVSEVALFSTCPQQLESAVGRTTGVPLSDDARGKLFLFAAAALVFLGVQRRGASRGQWLFLLLPIGTAVPLHAVLIETYPFFEQESLLRAVVATLAGALVFKEALIGERWRGDPRVTWPALALLAATALGCYYHFGMLQFHDAAKGRRTLVHTFDMRHYFPLAKYFREIRFDGLYLASLAAYVDNEGLKAESLKDVHFRDLRTSNMTTAPAAAGELPAIRARFSPERWAEFRRDMKYFQDTMGARDYLGSMQDHGGNATPVWILGGYLLFHNAPANEWWLTVGGLVDPALLLLLFVVVFRTFGLRVMLYTLVIFGATDFYQFGSNLMGSTLRQDWLVALGLGACALRRERFFLGGFLVAYAGLIRAFPATSTMFLAVPVVWWLVGYWREHKRWPARAVWVAPLRGALRSMAGALTAVISLAVLSSILFGFSGAWLNWAEKIKVHAVGPSVNNVGLRNVLAYRPSLAAKNLGRPDRPDPWPEWERTQLQTYAQRKPLFWGLNAIVLGLALLACYRRRIEEAALLGLLTIPFIFYPSNYYCHFVFLLPMAVAPKDAEIGTQRMFAWVVAALCAMCVGQYFSLEEGWTDLRYTYQSFVLLVTCVAILVPMAWEGRKRFLADAPAC